MAQKFVKKITKIEPVSSFILPEQAALKRVCAYCRVSTGSAEQKNSFESQVNYYNRLISEKEGWVFVGIYADEARTGMKMAHRDDFQQMMQDCRLGKIDLILTKSATRFARNTVDSIKAIRELKALGIGVYFEKERINTLSEKSEQMITIMSSIAQGESESISSNSKWSAVRRFKNGTFIISSPPYGYDNNEDGELVINQEERQTVRRIFDEYLGGKGSYAIARELEQDGIPTIRGAKEWLESVVRGILKNCAYEGDLLLQKTYTTEVVPFMRKTNRGELPQYLITDDHEPIITREEAEAVRQIYEYRRETQCADDVSVYQNRYAFSSRIVCGECGTNFRRQKIYIGKPYEKIQWCCYQHIKDSKKCGQKAIRQDILQEAFIRLWNRLASNYEEILIPMLAALKAIPGNQEQDREIKQIEYEIQELKKQSHRLSKVLTEGGMGSAIFIEKQNQLDAQLGAAQRKLRQLQNQKAFEREISQTEYLVTIFRNRPPIVEAYDEELFLLIIDKVIVLPERQIVFRLKNGLELQENVREAG